MGRYYSEQLLNQLLSLSQDPETQKLIREKDDPTVWAESHFFDPDKGEEAFRTKPMFRNLIRESRRHRAGRVGRQAGKCESADTRIQMADGSWPRAEDIYRRVGEHGQFEILSFDMNLYKHRTAKAIITDNGSKPMVSVETASGMHSKNTDNHPYFIWRDNRECPDWIEGKEVKIGDRIAVSRTLESCSVSPAESSCSPYEAELLGYLVGDGGTSQHTIKFSSVDQEIIDRINELLEKLQSGMFLSKLENGCDYAFKSLIPMEKGRGKTSWITDFTRKHGLAGCLSKEKSIPESIFTSSNEAIGAFLGAYWSTDGWIINRYRSEIGISSASRDLIEGTRTLLLRLGILSRMRYKPVAYKEEARDSWVLDITASPALEEFARKIPLIHRDKSKRIRNRIIKNHQSNTDTIPKGVWNYLNRKLSDLGWSHRKLLGGKAYDNQRLRQKYSPNRYTLGDQTGSLEDPFLTNMSESEIFWDTVTAVDHLGNEPSYAITIPETETLITDNIITHNTVHMCVDIMHTAAFNDRAVILVFVPEKKNMNRMREIMANLLRQSDLKHSFRTGNADKKKTGEVEADYDSEIKVSNGSVIRFFFMSHNPDKARGQRGTHIYIDEVEYLPEKAFPVITGILKSNPNIGIWATSTPSGLEGTWFRNFCDRCADPKNIHATEFHLPTTMEENWPEIEKSLRDVIFDEVQWKLEVLAEWAEAKGAVYKKEIIDRAIERSMINGYSVTMEEIRGSRGYAGAVKFLGVDWNNPQNGVRLVETAEIGDQLWLTRNEIISYEEYTQTRAVERILELYAQNRYHTISVDAGYGETQVELISKKLSLRGEDPRMVLNVVDSNRTNEMVIEYKLINGGRRRDVIRTPMKTMIVSLLSKYLEDVLILPEEEDSRDGVVRELRNFRRKNTSRNGGFIYTEQAHSLSALQINVHGYDKYLRGLNRETVDVREACISAPLVSLYSNSHRTENTIISSRFTKKGSNSRTAGLHGRQGRHII